jgi:hypothetical protein
MKILGGWYDRSIGDYQRHSAQSSGRRSVVSTEQTAFPTSSTLCHSDMYGTKWRPFFFCCGYLLKRRLTYNSTDTSTVVHILWSHCNDNI